MKFIPLLCCIVLLSGCKQRNNKKELSDKEMIMLLEQAWLDAEFNSDTTYLSTLKDSNFKFSYLSIEDTIENSKFIKATKNTSKIHLEDSIRIDSFKLKSPTILILSPNLATVDFSVLTFGKVHEKPVNTERFLFDIWVKRHGKWKLLSSQASPKLEE